MITALVGIGIFAGVRGTMAQNGNPNPQYGNYDYSKIRDPNWVRAEVNDYYSRPQNERIAPSNYDERDRNLGFSNIYLGAKKDVFRNPKLAILKETLRERESDKILTAKESDEYSRGFLFLYAWFNERINGLPDAQLKPGSNPQLTAETNQKIEQYLAPFLKQAPVAVKLTLGQ